jgi:hypothetical protein
VNAGQASALREAQQKWFEFATRQDALFAERVPEAADPEKSREAAGGRHRDAQGDRLH